MKNERSLCVGLCGMGLDAYWNQFAGLEERLKRHVVRLASRLARPGVAVVNLGLIDPEWPREAGHQCRPEDIDVLFLYVTTYALSNTVLPLVRRAGVPAHHCSVGMGHHWRKIEKLAALLGVACVRVC